ncbi:hypothetical protein CONPUDRAFT_156225 [Coniophora puteana RWD-64-598 SS2]|uniref:Uncharacterized protein n=1 Tax=Coniophora puteana (strain RWD-64-598) TaxID=741705 RepID=A0A5M3MGD1_CONPW|nr:uncharacterized protein CONPUDRAFT_156225 [Coniophora puteana RWD-64-598 SS2]EIW78223.1 hypothetical protein CONPUDRAFT_156225 [Coniophora puteana RWD-64-598 SS2]
MASTSTPPRAQEAGMDTGSPGSSTEDSRETSLSLSDISPGHEFIMLPPRTTSIIGPPVPSKERPPPPPKPYTHGKSSSTLGLPNSDADSQPPAFDPVALYNDSAAVALPSLQSPRQYIPSPLNPNGSSSLSMAPPPPYGPSSSTPPKNRGHRLMTSRSQLMFTRIASEESQVLASAAAQRSYEKNEKVEVQQDEGRQGESPPTRRASSPMILYKLASANRGKPLTAPHILGARNPRSSMASTPSSSSLSYSATASTLAPVIPSLSYSHSLAHSRSQSQSGSLTASVSLPLSSDSKYPFGSLPSRTFPHPRRFVPYLYDPALDDDSATAPDDDDGVDRAAAGGRLGVSARGLFNVGFLLVLITGLLFLFIFYPVITHFRAVARTQKVIANYKFNASGQAQILFAQDFRIPDVNDTLPVAGGDNPPGES